MFQERSRQYWPTCGSESYGKFLIDELRERDAECENVIVRELNITYTEVNIIIHNILIIHNIHSYYS